MKHKIWIAGALIVAMGTAWGVTSRSGTAGTTYRFAEVTRGDVESTVTATGAVQATETVEVGTQVSGQIAELYVDFNDRVEAGRLLARIDPAILEQEVRSAQVSIARNQAELDQARRELDRATELHAAQVVAVGELDAAEYRFALADAAYQSAEISLERAESNLEYTEIRAPIDGVVIARNVEVGQTVAASLSAPVLFVLAHDLEQMEILASVDESDIGQIAAGQEVHFSVQAYPNRNFEGTVRQVQLQAKTQENVVTYSVVVAVGNENGELLPGMTATLGIVIDKAEDILAVPNTALRFRATDEMQEAVAMTGDTAQSRSAAATGTRARPETGEQRPERAAGATAGSGGVGTLWYLDEAGGLRATRVRTGLSDGVQTVIVSAPEGVLHEGLPVIAAVTTASAPSTTDNPFQAPRQGQGGPGQRPGGF